MIVRSDTTLRRIALGQVQLYLGATTVDEVRRYRDIFGGVTLQGATGLRIARDLHRADDLGGVDLDPAVYVNSQATGGPQLCLDLETEPFDWIGAQRDLDLSIIRTAGRRIVAGNIDQVRVELAQPCLPRISVELVLDGGW